MIEFIDRFSNIMLQNGIDVYNKQELAEKFGLLSQLLVEENKKYNLTAIKEEGLIIPLHFVDCLLAEEFIPDGATMLDVGCGAGFPTLPLAIVRDDIDVVAMDSTEKKLGFINKVCAELGLKNVKTVVGRAEEYAKKVEYREKFDIVTARAVSRLNILGELCIPFLKKGGLFVAMKGALGREEAAEASGGMRVLGGEIAKLVEKKLYVSEGDEQDRCFVIIEKVSGTPALYPRMYSKIVKKPL